MGLDDSDDQGGKHHSDHEDDKPAASNPKPGGAGAFGQNDFEHGLCSCFSNCDVCICSWCCPCIQFGQNWERLNPHNEKDTSSSFLIWCSVYLLTIAFVDVWFFFLTSTFLRWWTRVEFRKALGYRERPIYDFLSALCCPCCMIAQDGNEIKAFKEGKLTHLN